MLYFLFCFCAVAKSCLTLRPNDCYSAAQSSLTLCDPMDGSTPGFPVHHQLLELAQTHVQ